VLEVAETEFRVERRRSDSARAKGRATLSRADVISAAAQLLDAGGIQKLSMRGLARALGTGSSTLYWHVRDQQELLVLVLDDSFAAVEVPEAGTWRERLIETLVRCHDVLTARPALVDVLWGTGWHLGPEVLRVTDAMIGLIAESGLADEEVADCYMALITLVFGFVAGERNTSGSPRYSEVRGSVRDGRPGEEPYPNLARYAPGADVSALKRQFRYAIEHFVSGIGASSAKRPRSARAASQPGGTTP
jgi:TetR/AcrR family transcriptional regulator, tetracycline repressor protein